MTNTFDFVIYYNQREFNSNLYGDDRIEKKSMLKYIWTSIDQPSWSESTFKMNVLEDEVALL